MQTRFCRAHLNYFLTHNPEEWESTKNTCTKEEKWSKRHKKRNEKQTERETQVRDRQKEKHTNHNTKNVKKIH